MLRNSKQSPNVLRLTKAILTLLKVTSLCLLGWCLYVFSGWVLNGSYLLLIEGQRLPGTIIEVEKHFSRFSQGRRGFMAYRPVVVFIDPNGKSNQFVDRYGDPNRPNVGDRVNVLFAPSRPSIAIVDKGPWKNWLDLYVAGAVFICSLLGLRRLSKIEILENI